MSDKITLDRQTFKVLAADTRIDMMKRLAVHKLTLTDLAEKMGMSPSTIKEHLDRLVEVGLIEQEDRGMKWKYYHLTQKGRDILTPQETKVWILLGTTLLILAGAVLSLTMKMSFLFAPAYGAAEATAPRGDWQAEPILLASGEVADGAPGETPSEMPQEPQEKMELMLAATGGNDTEMQDREEDGGGKAILSAGNDLEENAKEEADMEGKTTTAPLKRETIYAAAARPVRPPYVEIALICLSLVVIGGCLGYLIRRRSKFGGI